MLTSCHPLSICWRVACNYDGLLQLFVPAHGTCFAKALDVTCIKILGKEECYPLVLLDYALVADR